ncbi:MULTISPECIES: hypothetical protein [Flavobacterium]|uniref:hypothetical protein n=1 Tax=Flavobacterium TaxID=237 RepID=UPI001FCC7E0A|nr:MULTISPECIES: hypothetical protein [Flavobacterium]UOK43667.1 hypothetical protein LZF87_05995 [Flavobacterium enshiense]
MKSKTGIKGILGLSQKEMAKLTGVSRSQWAMSEIGQREMPPGSSTIVADLLTWVHTSKSGTKEAEKIIEAEKKNHKKWLEKEYRAQQHKVILLERKIQTVEKMRKDCFAALGVVQYLELFPDNITFAALALDVKERIELSLSKNSLHHLEQLQLKKETTEMLKNKIGIKLKI